MPKGELRKGHTFCAGCRTQKRTTYMGTITSDTTGRMVYRCGDCLWTILWINGQVDAVPERTLSGGRSTEIPAATLAFPTS